jgi:hypothetical protein
MEGMFEKGHLILAMDMEMAQELFFPNLEALCCATCIHMPSQRITICNLSSFDSDYCNCRNQTSNLVFHMHLCKTNGVLLISINVLAVLSFQMQYVLFYAIVFIVSSFFHQVSYALAYNKLVQYKYPFGLITITNIKCCFIPKM